MRLRVLDFGHVPALRSQAIYHGVARAMARDDDPVLTLVNPADPYVCVGLHQEVALEVDEDYCREKGLPIIRREVGGGAVYLDRNQMFFHFVFPAHKVTRIVAELYPRFIEPVVLTYRALGVAASFRPINDIHVNGRKIGGTGAASIEEATVMVGSFLFDFDVDTMARCLKVPTEKFRDKLRQGMSDYMTTLAKGSGSGADSRRGQGVFLREVAQSLDVSPEADRPTDLELSAIAEQEERLADPRWTYQMGRRFIDMGVKIAAGTHLTESAYKAPGGLIRVQLLERDGQIADILITGDFTCWPEYGVLALCETLKGMPLDAHVLETTVRAHADLLGMQIPGVGTADMVAAILAAVHREPH
jgi:lipoate---protein ligase